MAARVMGIYTTGNGIAIALLAGAGGRKCLHASWIPAFSQSGDSPLYPAEEIHKRVRTLSSDITCLFDEYYPIIPFSVHLPRMKPVQVYQALRIELESRGVTDLMRPVVGFCPSHPGRKGVKKTRLSGFGLVMESSNLQLLKQKHRAFGIVPDLISLPIFPLALTFIQQEGESPGWIYLIEGSLVMTALVRDREIQDLEIFYGGEAALSEHLESMLLETPGIKVYGFEVGGRPVSDDLSAVNFVAAGPSGEGGQNADLLIRNRYPLSYITLAILMARLPTLVGSLEFGGIHAIQTDRTTEKKTRKVVVSSLGLAMLILFGVGAIYGILGDMDHQIYREQKTAIRQAIQSILSNAPPIIGTAIITSKTKEFQRVGAHLAPMLTPSTMKLPSVILPILDRVKGVRVVRISSFPHSLDIVFASIRPQDLRRLKSRIEQAGEIEVEKLTPVTSQSIRSGDEFFYGLKVKSPSQQTGKGHAE